MQASRNYTIHPLGVFYDKANEGSQYQDGTTGNETADNAIAPNGTYSYRWIVPDSVAPAENDPACLTWMYCSNVDSTRDIHSGMSSFDSFIHLKCSRNEFFGLPYDIVKLKVNLRKQHLVKRQGSSGCKLKEVKW